MPSRSFLCICLSQMSVTRRGPSADLGSICCQRVLPHTSQLMSSTSCCFSALTSECGDLRGAAEGKKCSPKYRLPPGQRPHLPVALSGGGGGRLFFSFPISHGEGRGSCAAREVRGPRLRVRSFPGVKALLELGAGVAEMEALLADCVVAVKADEHDAPGRVDPLPGLRKERQT